VDVVFAALCASEWHYQMRRLTPAAQTCVWAYLRQHRIAEVEYLTAFYAAVAEARLSSDATIAPVGIELN
jgi:hypothetical protein